MSPSLTRRLLPGDRVIRPILFLALLIPSATLVFRLQSGDLGANPVEALTDETGEWALRILLLSLMVTPLRWLTGSVRPLRFRRQIGLFAWFYASLHVTVYLVLEQQFDFAAVFADIIERPYITAGLLAFVIMCLLGATSNRAAVRRLKKRWQGLHRWTYVAATAAVAHFVWLAKGEVSEPYVYALILLLLLIVRFGRQTVMK